MQPDNFIPRPLKVSDLKTGTDGELITWDASGNPATVAAGTATHVLTSNGAGAAPTFQAAGGGGGPRAFTYVIAASNSRDNTGADAVCDGTADEVEINAGIDLCTTLGGTVMLLDGTFNISTTKILPKDNVTIRGQGKGTILKRTANTHSIIDDGSANEWDYVTLADLTFDGNTVSTTYIISNAWGNHLKTRIQNCNFYNYGNCINWKSDRGTFTNNIFYNTNGNGAYTAINLTAAGSENIVTNNIIMAGNTASTNIGINNASLRAVITGNYVEGGRASGGKAIVSSGDGCVVANNVTHYGYNPLYLSGTSNIIKDNVIYYSASHAIYDNGLVDSVVSGNTIYAMVAATDDCIYVAGTATGNIYSGNNFSTVGGTDCRYFINFNSANAKNNLVTDNSCLAWTTGFWLPNDPSNQAMNNVGANNLEDVRLMKMKNTSGGQLVLGDVVVLKAAAGGNEITTTTSAGDPMVIGMVAETIADTASGLVQVSGKTVSLKVDGTDDIAIGDRLSCFTTAGIAQKTASGEMSFAIALEGYTSDDSSGIIDALLISPRLEA